MTRLRSDSSSTCNTTTTTTTITSTTSTSTTEEDSSSVISECNLARPELQILHNIRGPTFASAIEIESSTEDSNNSSSDENSQGIVVQVPQGLIDERSSSVCHQDYDVLETDAETDQHRVYEDKYRNDNGPSLLEEALHELGLTSARRLTTEREQDYDLRPNFAILKHKTENYSSSSERDIARSQNNDNIRRRYPKTPDWFFNIPDTRSPFPTFGSGLAEDSD